MEPSEPWWKFISDTFMGQKAEEEGTASAPPRPNSLRLYTFGSPRVGNKAFADLFDALLAEGWIDEAYRIVNGDDIVARLPRSFNLLLADVNYEHCGPTALVTQPTSDNDTALEIWVEGESDDRDCPVRDGKALTSPLGEGGLLSELFADEVSPLEEGKNKSTETDSWLNLNKLGSALSKLSTRMSTLKASDVATVLGIDRRFTERELQIVKSFVEGKGIAHHLEDEYYTGVAGASGFLAKVGEDIVAIDVTPQRSVFGETSAKIEEPPQRDGG